MSLTGHVIRGTIILVVFGTLASWGLWRWLKKSDEPYLLILKWILSAGVFAFMIKVVAPMVGRGDYVAAFMGVPLTAASGVVLAIIWRRNIAELVAQPFGSLYDGGSTPPEPRPAYSVAQSRQKQGKPLEAIVEIRKQLDRFPTDFEGHMLLAGIQAEDLKDLPAAEATIQALCAQPGHAPINIAFALYSLADWYLAIGADREAARRALEQVSVLLPETEYALTAAQRIAHLGNPDMPISPHDGKKFVVPDGFKKVGLSKIPQTVAPVEKDPGQLAGEYVRHLEQHPQDAEARENLAAIYADHYQRLDLAVDQLEQLIQQPNQPDRLVARWLNLMADLQVRSGADYESIRATLQRIVERNPGLAAAENARKRIELLRLEIKGKEKSQDVKLGSYEQNIGLKRSRSG